MNGRLSVAVALFGGAKIAKVTDQTPSDDANTSGLEEFATTTDGDSVVPVQSQNGGQSGQVIRLTGDLSDQPAEELFMSVKGDLHAKVISTDNSRSLFISPAVMYRKCGYTASQFVNATVNDPAKIQSVNRVLGYDNCSPPGDGADSDYDRLRMSVLDPNTYIGRLRVDSAQPEQAGADERLDGSPISWSWSKSDPITYFVGSANYVDIGRESVGQSYLFFSGVLIGLASAAFPLGIDQLRKRP